MNRWADALYEKRRGDPPDRPAACWCGTSAVMIPKSWIGKFTKSCGREGCNRQGTLEIKQDGE